MANVKCTIPPKKYYLISKRDAWSWWEGAAEGYHGIEAITASGRARCRACGAPLPQGTPALRFTQEVGDWATFGFGEVICYIHATPCVERPAVRA